MDGVTIEVKSGAKSFYVNSSAVPIFDAFLRHCKGEVAWMNEAPIEFIYEQKKGEQCSLKSAGDYSNMLLICSFLNRKMVDVMLKPVGTLNIDLNTPPTPAEQVFSYGNRIFRAVQEISSTNRVTEEPPETSNVPDFPAHSSTREQHHLFVDRVKEPSARTIRRRGNCSIT